MMQMVNEYQHELKNINCAWMPWLVCLVASLFFFYEFIQGNMFASIADNIMRDFNVQADKMTYLSSVYYVSNVLFLFIAGILLDRFSAKKTILIAMFFCVLSTFILAYAHSFYLALFCRFIAGIGSAFCFLGPIRIASRWFPAKRMALVTGIIVTLAMTGGMLAQYPLTKLVSYMGWRDSVLAVAWLGVFILIIMIFGVKEKLSNKERPIQKNIGILASTKKAYLNLQTVSAALYASLMNMSVAVLGALMGTLYLVQRLGVSKEQAAMVNSMLFLGAIIGGPLVGWCSDKLRLRVLPMKWGVYISLLIVLSIVYLPLSLSAMMLLFFMLGLSTSTQVISYPLVAESCPSTMTATAVSMVSILTQGGYIVFQNVFSWLLLMQNNMHIVNRVPVYTLESYQIAVLMLPIGLVLAGFVVFRIKETHGRHLV